MAKKRDKNPNRFALIIFIGLVIFCMAQLAWWIIFQVDLGQQVTQSRLDLLAIQHSGYGKIPQEAVDEIESQARGRIIMFVSEGSFFMLVVLSGAWIIYRTLKRSIELQRQQRNFIQSITHEFRTPLTSLRLYLQTLQTGRLDNEKASRVYDSMLEDCDRLDSMIDTVLETGYIDRDDYKLKLEPVNFSEDVNDYIKSMETLVTRRGGQIKSELSPEIIINGDFSALKRAVQVLIENAVNYSPPERIEISVNLSKNDREAILEVCDKGFGLTSAETKKLFERFYRGEDGRKKSVKGTGLGLFLAGRIIEGHGGRIIPKSDGPDKGSCFEIHLPLVKK